MTPTVSGARSRKGTGSSAAPRFNAADHWEELRVSVVIPADAFSVPDFADKFLGDRDLDLRHHSLAGPLRIPGRASSSVEVSGQVALHDADASGAHIHVMLLASRERGPRHPKDVMAMDVFIDALVAAAPDGVFATSIIGRHRFSRSEWETALELPVPLPAFGPAPGISPAGAATTAGADASTADAGRAQLTGVEVSFDGPDSQQSILLSVRGTELQAFTSIIQRRGIGRSLLQDGIATSTALATRLLNEVVKQRTDI